VFALAALWPAGLDAAGPTLFPNSQKYSDKAPPATGRSGTAALAARALIDKDDQTLLEMTTGALDSDTTATGRIVKAQVKMLTSSGEAASTFNYNALDSAYVALASGEVRRGQPLQFQVNIRDVDGARTDVLTVADVVRARPDLVTSSLDSPARAMAHTPVNITAVVRERNGDVGARADCLLYVDDVEVDRARGIWVDAGDAVSCAFTQTFDVPGTKALRVTAANLTPGDWDLENNSAAGTIEITQRFDAVEATFHEEEYANIFDSRGHFEGTTSGFEYQSRFGQSGWQQSAIYRGYVFVDPVQFPIQVDGTISDGTITTAVHFADLTPEHLTGGAGGFCHSGWLTDLSSARVVNLSFGDCQTWEGVRFFIVHLQRDAGEVTFYSEGFGRYWYTWNGQTTTFSYQYNRNTTFWQGGDERMRGSDIAMNVTVGDGRVTYELPVDVVVQEVSFTDTGYPERCSAYAGSGEYCYSQTSYRRVRAGSVVVGTPGP
jgi:hypothetical protein